MAERGREGVKAVSRLPFHRKRAVKPVVDDVQAGEGELGTDLVKYASAVAAINILDYFAVVVLCSALRERLIGDAGGWKLQLFNGVTITTVSGMIFVLRYVLYRKIFRPAGDDAGKSR